MGRPRDMRSPPSPVTVGESRPSAGFFLSHRRRHVRRVRSRALASSCPDSFHCCPVQSLGGSAPMVGDKAGRCRRPPALPSLSSCPDLFRVSTSCDIAVRARSGRTGGGTWMPGTSPGMTVGGMPARRNPCLGSNDPLETRSYPCLSPGLQNLNRTAMDPFRASTGGGTIGERVSGLTGVDARMMEGRPFLFCPVISTGAPRARSGEIRQRGRGGIVRDRYLRSAVLRAAPVDMTKHVP